MNAGFFTHHWILLFTLFLIAGEPFAGKKPAFSRSLSDKADSVERISMMFFIEHGTMNSLDLYSHPSFRNLTERFAFSTLAVLPAGLLFAESGVVNWSPSESQFRDLQAQAIALPFQARGLASGRQVEGLLRVVARGEIVPAETSTSELASSDSLPSPEAAVDQSLIVTVSKISPLLPTEPTNWNRRREGQAFDFRIGARGGSESYTFELIEPTILADKLSPDGRFAWTPDYNTVSSREGVKVFNIRLRIRDTGGQDSISQFMLWVDHVNRPPAVTELPTFYIQYNQLNRFDLSRGGMIADPDGDSLIFKPALQEMPQGMTLSPRGLLEWRPSVRQFNQIRQKPVYLTFLVDDYPAGERTVGQLRIDVSQEDLPPEITLIPEKDQFEIEEHEELHLSFFVIDPNGDDDILTFNFVSEVPDITEQALKQISVNQYEFTWMPGYEFIQEENADRSFSISFYAVDKSNNRNQKNILVKVQDVEDIEEKDRVLYDQYRTVLERSWDLVQQLNNKEKELEKRYRQAKNGRKNRSIVMASVGGLTGLSPVVFLENPQGQKVMAGIGGTTTATIGTLEASNVLGESPSDIMRDLNYVSQKRNDLLIHGNIFAGKYALPISRRDKGFATDLRSLTVNLNLQDVAKLELDAAWQNPNKATTRNIRTVFKDFNPDPRFEGDYGK